MRQIVVQVGLLSKGRATCRWAVCIIFAYHGQHELCLAKHEMGRLPVFDLPGSSTEAQLLGVWVGGGSRFSCLRV